MLRSERTATSLGSIIPNTTQNRTIKDFLQLLRSREIERVQLEASNTYRSNILNDSGSQFTVFTDDGIKKYGGPVAVVKCAKFHLSSQALANDNQTRLVNSLYRELLALSHHSLRSHPNIVRLLYYDLVDDGDKNIPTLIMERAKYGSLAGHLEAGIAMTEENKISLCADVTAGLVALHQAEIVHGDVKADNVLVFESPDPHRRFLAKLTDFGSIVSIAPSHVGTSRYYGTRLYNAPEVDEQSGNKTLGADGLVKCDAYSLGLLIMHIITGELSESLTAQDRNVLKEALQFLAQANLRQEVHLAVESALEKLLPWSPKQRCVDLALVHEVLKLCQEYESETLPNKSAVGRSEAEVAAGMEAIFGAPDYLDYGLAADEDWTSKQAQVSTFGEILDNSKSADKLVASRALFQLSTAYAIGFGIQANIESALEYVLESAAKGYLPAQAHFHTMHIANAQEIPIDSDTQLDWLCRAAGWGSFYAGASLKQIDEDEYRLSRADFHRRGGYNQFFYSRDQNGLAHLNSKDSRTTSSEVDRQQDSNTASLLLSSVIYGDTTLLLRLIKEEQIDINVANAYGESLLTLCCKGGHIDTLKVLVSAGARADTRNEDQNTVIRESALHWLIAFDDDSIEEAASLLRSAGVDLDHAPEITWNHPSIDLPGMFPRATPLHFATYCANNVCAEAILKRWPHHINHIGPIEEMGTPFSYSITLLRADIADLLHRYHALNDRDSNRDCLADVGTLPTHEVWATNGLHQTSPGTLVSRCISLVAKEDPSLLEETMEYGFTPLLRAAQGHATDAVAALIGHGCSVHTTTTYENDNRTALNLLTENQLSHEEDALFEILVNAGASLDHRSDKAGKMLIHYAARDNCVWIARKVLDLRAHQDAETLYGETPLHIAAQYGALEMTRLLLDRKADVSVANTTGSYTDRDWKGLTPIAIAVVKRRAKVVSALLDYASPIARPLTGHTIIHLAATEPDVRALQMLLEMPRLCQSDVLDARDHIQRTALHLCAGYFQRQEHLRLLVDAGADINAVTEGEFSVLDIVYFARDEAVSFVEGLFSRPVSAEPEPEPSDSETETGSPDAEDGFQPSTRHTDSMEAKAPDREGPSEIDNFIHTNLTANLASWDQLIMLLEHRGARRSCSDPVPEKLLSLM